MSGRSCRGSVPSSGGFTLIEVIAALVIFSAGVIMVLRLTTALSRQMEYAAATSELVVRTEERLDSLESLPFDSLTLGSRSDTLTVRGIAYRRTVSVTAVTGLLRQIAVTMSRADGQAGASSSMTSFAAAPW